MCSTWSFSVCGRIGFYILIPTHVCPVSIAKLRKRVFRTTSLDVGALRIDYNLTDWRVEHRIIMHITGAYIYLGATTHMRTALSTA